MRIHRPMSASSSTRRTAFVLLILALGSPLLALPTASPPPAAALHADGDPYPDVPDTAWYAPAAAWANEHRIMTGYANGTFGPDITAPRKQIAVWLWRQAGSPAPAGLDPYPDVPDTAWYAPAAAWANEHRIMTGYANGTFGPDITAPRKQIAVWLWRQAGSPAPAGLDPYPDVPDTAWYAPAAAWAHEHRIMTGYANGTFGPDITAPRKQIAVWLWRQAGSPDGSEMNLVVIFTDDQTLESMRFMPRTRSLLGDGGTTFSQAVANYPLCCPARATLLTGQYAHNHGVLGNVPPVGGYAAFDDEQALPVWLADAGYTTAHVGKYLNFYGNDVDSQGVPPGWDRWFATIDGFPQPQGYYDYAVVDDGEIVEYGDHDDDYLTDVMAQRATEDIAAMHASGRPFYLQVANLAPHSGEGRDGHEEHLIVPAPRHEGTLGAELPPIGPSYAEEDRSDKPLWIRELGGNEWPEIADEVIRIVYRQYAESLLAVDELVDRVVAELARVGALEHTIVVFTSDNGWTFGENHLGFLKNVPYEAAARVPLMVRGPGFPAGVVRDQPVGHIDIVPTLLAAAGVEPPTARDGEPLHPFAASAVHRGDRVMLVSNGPGRSVIHHYEAARTATEWYTEHGSAGDEGTEYYDLTTDPAQLESRHDDPSTATARAELDAALDQLVGCVGASCQVSR